MSVLERPRVLLLHGFLSGKAVWGRLVRELEDEAECLAPDLPGYGSRRGWRGDFSLERVIEELAPLVADGRPVAAVGHSMGGIVALGLAERYAQQVVVAGVIGLPVFSGRSDGLAYLGRRGPLIRAFVSRDGPAHAACTVAHATRRLWVPWASRRYRTLPAEALLCTFDHDAKAHVGGLENLVFGGLAGQLAGSVRVPVRVLHGTADRAAPLERVQALAQEAGWPLRVVPGANHQVIVEQPRVVGEWIHRSVLAASGDPAETWGGSGRLPRAGDVPHEAHSRSRTG